MNEITTKSLIEIVNEMGEIEEKLNEYIEMYNILTEEICRRFPPLKESFKPKVLLEVQDQNSRTM